MPPRYCPDCKSEHLNAPCGLAYAQRLRSHQTAVGWMSRDKKDWFDDQPLKDVWGLDKHERKEQLMEETGGHGFIDNPKDLTPEAAQHFGLA